MSLRIALLIALSMAGRLDAETLGEYWDTAGEEANYYRIVEIPIPEAAALEAGSFEIMPDNRLAIGTRRNRSDRQRSGIRSAAIARTAASGCPACSECSRPEPPCRRT